jgi:hypothetical protein
LKLTFEVFRLPDMEMLAGAELQEGLRQALIAELERRGYPFGSGYGVIGFHDDDE